METTIFVLVFLVITGGLLLDVIPDKAISPMDTFVGRTLLFLLPGALGGLMVGGGVSEAIMVGTVSGLILDRIHDSRAGSFVATKLGSLHPPQTSDPASFTPTPPTSTTASAIADESAPFKPKGGSGGKVIRDMSPSYTGAVSERLGLIPMMSPGERFSVGPSVLG